VDRNNHLLPKKEDTMNYCLNCRVNPATEGKTGADAYCPECQKKRDFALEKHGEILPRDSFGRFLPWVAYFNNAIVAVSNSSDELKDDPVVLEYTRSGHALVRVNLLEDGASFMGRVPF
jgi:hypothetical protein